MIRETLISYRPHKTVDGGGADGGGTAVGGGREGAAVLHGMAYFHAGGLTAIDYTTGFLGDEIDHRFDFFFITGSSVNTGG